MFRLQPTTVSPSIDPFSLPSTASPSIDRQYPVLVVTVLINHYYCHSRITTTIARTGIDPSSLTSTAATASQTSSVASAPASTTVPADATLIFRSPQELLLLPKRDSYCFCS